jgi:hypothetical protein
MKTVPAQEYFAVNATGSVLFCSVQGPVILAFSAPKHSPFSLEIVLLLNGRVTSTAWPVATLQPTVHPHGSDCSRNAGDETTRH